jgi:hypothetical protein
MIEEGIIEEGMIEEGRQRAMRTPRKLALIAFSIFGIVLTTVPEVLAVVGRPLTPVSYAGVARRTVRRNAY